MTRIEAAKQVEAAVRAFSVDDVKDWLAEAATVLSGEARRAGNADEAVEYMRLAKEIARIGNRGL